MGERTMNTWLGLLKWSLAYNDGTKPVGAAGAGGAGTTSEVKPMSEEDRKWLQDALKAHILDEVERMKIIISTLRVPDDASAVSQAVAESKWVPLASSSSSSAGASTADQKAAAGAASADLAALSVKHKTAALDELDERVETIDNAQDFFKIGGYEPLRDTLVNTKQPELVWRAAQVFATVLQNNPKCQAIAASKHLIDSLLPLLQLLSDAKPAATATASSASASASSSTAAAAMTTAQREKIVTKALLATSGAVRDCPDALVQFIAGGGLPTLLKLVAATTAPHGLRRKAVSLLRHIIAAAAEQREMAAIAAATAASKADVKAGKSKDSKESGIKITTGSKKGPINISGGPAGASEADSKPATSAADAKSAAEALAALKSRVVSSGGVDALAALIDHDADVDLRSTAVAALIDLVSAEHGDDDGTKAAAAALAAPATSAVATAALRKRLIACAAVDTTKAAPSSDDVDDIRNAYSEVEPLMRLAKLVPGAFAADATKQLGAEFRRIAVAVAKADADERKKSAAAQAAAGGPKSNVYSGTFSNSDTPLLK